jgi:hypothetical protein
MSQKINPLEIIKSMRQMDVKEIINYFKLHGYRFWSWGPQAFTTINDKGLRFKVNGHHHKGHVYIFVNGLDLFDLYLTSTQGTIKEIINDVYLEDLFDILDSKIEYINEYSH